VRSELTGLEGFGRSDKDVRDKDGILKTFWPKDLAAEIPHSRLWSFGWNAAYDDSTPLTTAANNLVNELSDRVV
jgi:hypothetical protein